VVTTSRSVEDAALPRSVRETAPMVVAATTALSWWALSGLETVAFAWALAEGTRRFVAAARDGRGASPSGALILAVAALLRPEALLHAPLLGLGAALYAGRAGCFPSRRTLALSAMAFALPVGAWFAFRLGYYGAWLPNTFYAKVGGEAHALERGARYLAVGATCTPLLPLLLALGCALRRRMRPEVALPATVAVVHLVYVALVGGDYMPLFRLSAPVLPLLTLAAAGALGARLEEVVSQRSRVAVALLLSASMAAGLAAWLQPIARQPEGIVRRYEVAGRWLDAVLPPDAVVASSAIGAVGYLGRRRVLDMLGLIDTHIARQRDPRIAQIRAAAGHGRADAGYVLRRRPDVILLANVWVWPAPLTPQSAARNPELLLLPDRLLFADPRFPALYEVVNYRLGDGRWFGMAIRRDSPAHPGHPGYRGPPR